MSTDDGNATTVETIEFETSDGVRLHGELARVEGPRAVAVVCHPHPQYGGNMLNPVVGALFARLADAGITTIRFDFRSEFDDGVGELLDVRAAIDATTETAPGVPVISAGYSFGAVMALTLDDDRVTHRILVAPPLASVPPRSMPGADRGRALDRPVLVVTPAHDQFAPPDVVEGVIAEWTDAELQVVPSVDHFLLGRADDVARRAVDWLDARLP